MADMGQGFSTGLQGATLGALLGGGAGAAIGGGIGLAAGLYASKKAQAAAKVMMEKYNAEVVKNAARDLFDMRRVQNQENLRTAQALAQYQDNLKVQSSSIVAQFGAADIIGSSAQALQQTLELQSNEAANMTMINAVTGIENHNIRLEQMTNQRVLSLQRNTGSQPMDAGQLLSQGVSLYKQLNTDGTLAADLKRGGNQLMGAFKSVWSTPSTQSVNSGGLSGLFDATKSSTKALFNSSVMSA